MTARRRNSRPTWLIWWIGVVLAAAWPLAAFAHYPGGDRTGQITSTGRIAEAAWLTSVAIISASIAATRRRRENKHTARRQSTHLA